MTLTLVLSHPSMGTYAPPVVSGTVTVALDRYPRWGFDAQIRPEPSGTSLLQSPYGTTAMVFDRQRVLYSGPVVGAAVRRPDGGYSLQGQDPIAYLAGKVFSERPGQYLPGSPMPLPAWIATVAEAAGVADRIRAGGSGGSVDPRAVDVAGKDAWRIVEDQLIANDLDITVDGGGALVVGPTAALKTSPDRVLRVGEQGTVTAYDIDMRRRYNEIIITHRARKEGEDDRYIDGVWRDPGAWSGVAAVGPQTYTKTVDVGADWWDDPAGKQAQADRNAAAAAQTLRGTAREVQLEAIPDYTVTPGMTVDVTFMSGRSDRFLCIGCEWPLQPGPMRLTLRNPDPDAPTTLIRRP